MYNQSMPRELERSSYGSSGKTDSVRKANNNQNSLGTVCSGTKHWCKSSPLFCPAAVVFSGPGSVETCFVSYADGRNPRESSAEESMDRSSGDVVRLAGYMYITCGLSSY